jgi:hypothetical protein
MFLRGGARTCFLTISFLVIYKREGKTKVNNHTTLGFINQK